MSRISSGYSGESEVRELYMSFVPAQQVVVGPWAFL